MKRSPWFFPSWQSRSASARPQRPPLRPRGWLQWPVCSPAALLWAACVALLPGSVWAFSGVVVPARFVLKAKPGEVLQQSLELGNDSTAPDEFLVRSADWEFNAQGGVAFRDDLAPGSCRPWVRLERSRVPVVANGKRRYRFEVHVPADTKPQECRFALMIEKAPDTAPEIKGANIQFPVQGRIGVIVYVAVGEVAPKIELRGVTTENLQGRKVPVALLANTGSAHGRADGVIEGVDAKGVRIEFVVSNFPILAGDVRSIALWPQDGADGRPVNIAWPVRLKGLLEWSGGKQDIDTSLP